MRSRFAKTLVLADRAGPPGIPVRKAKNSPPRYYTKFPKIPGDPITSYRPPTGSQSTLNEAFDRGMEKDREREIAQ